MVKVILLSSVLVASIAVAPSFARTASHGAHRVSTRDFVALRADRLGARDLRLERSSLGGPVGGIGQAGG